MRVIRSLCIAFSTYSRIPVPQVAWTDENRKYSMCFFPDRRHKAQQMGYPSNITKHKCAICGRTERDGDDLEFRFCSKCNGNYEYCNEHLFTHEHVK